MLPYLFNVVAFVERDAVKRRGNNSLGLLKRLSLWSQSKSHTVEEPSLGLSLLKTHGVE